MVLVLHLYKLESAMPSPQLCQGLSEKKKNLKIRVPRGVKAKDDEVDLPGQVVLIHLQVPGALGRRGGSIPRI